LLPLPLLLSADNAGNTAADVALSLNDEESYRVIRDAGVRSGVFAIHSSVHFASTDFWAGLTPPPLPSITWALLELILQLLASRGAEADALVLKEEDDTALGSTNQFLSSRLRYTTDAHGQDICLLQDGDTEIGVMMGWERGISAFRFLKIMCVAFSGAVVTLSATNGALAMR
jgi:protein arginine N-methyltransferase 2